MLQIWQDELLQWDPADYGGAYRTTLEGSEIWLPEIVPLNRQVSAISFYEVLLMGLNLAYVSSGVLLV